MISRHKFLVFWYSIVTGKGVNNNEIMLLDSFVDMLLLTFSLYLNALEIAATLEITRGWEENGSTKHLHNNHLKWTGALNLISKGWQSVKSKFRSIGGYFMTQKRECNEVTVTPRDRGHFSSIYSNRNAIEMLKRCFNTIITRVALTGKVLMKL